MRFSIIGLLALPLLANAAPNPWKVTVSVEEEPLRKAASLEPVVKMGNRTVTPLSEAIPTLDDSRIMGHPDRVLLARLREFLKTFTTGDFDGMRSLQTDNYTQTDIPIRVVRQPRDVWYQSNKQFASLLTDLRVIALTLHGSSEPGSFSIMEHVVWFKLIGNPPPPAIPNLPVGAKPGDIVGMINICVLFWGDEGLITQELEYGRLTWLNFDTSEFDAPTAALVREIQLGQHQGFEL